MTASSRGAANRRRGADAERKVVNYLRANGFPDARRYLAGDSRQPGDIDFAPGIHLEVKDVASSAWPTWRAQAVDQCRGRIPIVVRRTRGVTDVGEWVAYWLDEIDAPFIAHAWCSRTSHYWHCGRFADVVAALRSDSERTS